MSAPRRPLKVDTFPFLAVLLCAMGALIVVLLTMDRKAKRVARAKAEDAARRQTDDRDAQVAARRADHERRKGEAQAAWQRKHDELKAAVDAEEAALSAELRAVRARLAEASRRLAGELDSLRTARARLSEEQTKLTAAEAALAAAHNDAGGDVQRLSAAEAARAKLAGDLESMERTQKRIEADRQRDPKTYSLIPYRGKRGSNQRPVYVECASSGLIFHPDRQRVPGDDLKALRAEVTRRVAARGGDPYLMLLVRPDGIEGYYRVRASVSDLDITFGYEMVDAGWEFHVPDEPAAPAPATVSVPPMPSKPRPAVGGAARLMPPGARAGTAVAKGALSASVNMQRPRPFGSDEGSPAPNPDAPLPAGVGAFPPGGPAQHPDAPLPGGGIVPGPAGIPSPAPAAPATPPAAEPAPGPKNPYLTAEAVRDSPPPGPPIARGGPADDGPRLPELPEATIRPKPRQEREPLRLAQIDSNEVTVFVECCAGYVVVYPGKKAIMRDKFASGLLLGHVKQGLARPLFAGGTPKPQVRYIIRPGGEETFHDATDALRGLSVPMTQYRVQPGDDVARLVGGR
ncbi:MAG: hypothetical protein ACRC33_23450 [Gemmataceae bacterium]